MPFLNYFNSSFLTHFYRWCVVVALWLRRSYVMVATVRKLNPHVINMSKMLKQLIDFHDFKLKKYEK